MDLMREWYISGEKIGVGWFCRRIYSKLEEAFIPATISFA